MLFCIVTFNLWLHYNKLLTYLLTYLLSLTQTSRARHYSTLIFLTTRNVARPLRDSWASCSLILINTHKAYGCLSVCEHTTTQSNTRESYYSIFSGVTIGGRRQIERLVNVKAAVDLPGDLIVGSDWAPCAAAGSGPNDHAAISLRRYKLYLTTHLRALPWRHRDVTSVHAQCNTTAT